MNHSKVFQTRVTYFVDARASRASTLYELCNQERIDDKFLAVSGSSPRENPHVVNGS